MPPTMSQPSTRVEGPPERRAIPYEVMQPARMEMIENETAKLENPDIPRVNSWV